MKNFNCSISLYQVITQMADEHYSQKNFSEIAEKSKPALQCNHIMHKSLLRPPQCNVHGHCQY